MSESQNLQEKLTLDSAIANFTTEKQVEALVDPMVSELVKAGVSFSPSPIPITNIISGLTQ